MPDNNQKIDAARKVYDTYWASYLKGDVVTFTSALDETYEMIGASEKEVYHTKADGIEFLKGQAVEISVKDNRPGIPHEIRDKILQPFFTTKKGTEGTGLGLSITNDIIKAHGGRIEITSLPGKGSVFTIQLPK
jgi:signal transduction histidine kinase